MLPDFHKVPPNAIFPKSVIESIEQLKSLENNDVLKFKVGRFVFVPENKLFVRITTE